MVWATNALHGAMWPFNNNDDNGTGCGNHHFPDDVNAPMTSEVRVKRDYGYHIQTRETLKCQHEGCHKTKKEWVTHTRLPSAALAAHYRPEDYEDHDLSDEELELAETIAHIHDTVQDNNE